MSTQVSSDTWDSVDQWWDRFVDTESVIGTADTTKNLDNRWRTGLWGDLDPWWDASVQTHSLVETDSQAATLDSRWREGEWTNLDPWWESFNDVRQADIAELREVLEDCNHLWNQSESRFDQDPLATDWTRQQNTRGPLRPNQEENWSQWLAHLLRSSSGAFVSELFDTQYDDSPDTVQREAYLPDQQEPDRYADILVHFDNRGISIEVKKNDEHYSKTTHTAGLIENQHTGEWHHVILLPKYKQSALRGVFGDDLEVSDDGSVTLHSEQSSPISVVFWQDVSQAIRCVLQHRTEDDPHFEASAYLFCTLIEQKLLQFIPAPMIDQIATTDDVVHASQSLSVATGSTEEQINHLREFENSTQ